MLLANFIIVGIVILMLITFSIFILIGKGDDLIAGYNTASKEERAKYDIGRLRKVSGYGLLLTCLPTDWSASFSRDVRYNILVINDFYDNYSYRCHDTGEHLCKAIKTNNN